MPSRNILQLDPPIHVDTPRGPALAMVLIDYGPDYDLMWVTFTDDTGECWTWPNPKIRAQKKHHAGTAHGREREIAQQRVGVMDLTSLIGLVAALGATAANVPQVMKTWRTSETGDLSLKMLAILTASLALWTVYGLMRGDFIIVASNAISACFAGYLTFAKIRHG